MNFQHFLRFFRLADDNEPMPVDEYLPQWRLNELIAAVGDRWRLLVPKSTIYPYRPQDLVIRSYKNSVTGAVLGTLRAQASESYTEIRIRVRSAPAANEYRQFAIETMDGRVVLGTFRYQAGPVAPTRDEFVQAIRRHYEGYLYTPVTVDTDGPDITIRGYHSDRFRLGNAALRIGIGKVVGTRGVIPMLTHTKLGSVTTTATDTYTVTVGEDIESGNVYSLNGSSYTAAGGESPDVILSRLGVFNNSLTVAAGTSMTATALPGTYTLPNGNRPTISAAYSSTSSPNDLYTVTVGADVVAGNIYQLSAAGMTTRTKVATASDTATTIAAFFNSTSGKAAVPIGATPSVTVSLGVRQFTNTNNPQLYLSGKVNTPAATVDRYLITVGSAIQQGMKFYLQDKVVTATDEDTILTIAQKLTGRTINVVPFVLDLPVSTVVNCYAEQAPRYNLADDGADVELTASPKRFTNLPVVAEIDFTSVDSCQLAICKGSTVLAVSNPVRIRPDAGATVLMRYTDEGETFDYNYQEPGLVQQIRIPATLGPAKLAQSDSVSQTLDGQYVRGTTEAEYQYTLTTLAMWQGFHAALWQALKHRQVWIDGRCFVAKSELKQLGAIGARRLEQSQTELTEANRVSNKRAFLGAPQGSESTGYAQFLQIDAPENLPVYVVSSDVCIRLRAGTLVPPGRYQLQIRTGNEALELRCYVNNVRYNPGRAVLTPDKLNRTEQDILLGAGAVVTIQLVAAQVAVTAWSEEVTDTGRAYSEEFPTTYFE
ncbi:hypothetical protein [Arsenicibacter rosenii]|uniref:Uncharacterized protein n=1 Tax=Arsenicibacter rosenii TaxID=1750698 RepID=A0A1S2VB11_9BACT|nr:hypothetical protein [Arsenicibacter rosenii]OIN55882.1 hypothetical protein BLX24_27900 [Arsenicibacter rosenii]